MIAISLMIAAIISTFSYSVFARNNYIITDGDTVTTHTSYSADPAQVLDEVGIELREEDTYTTAYNDGVNEITIRRMQIVTVVYRGTQSVIGTYGEPVGGLLARMGIALTAQDYLSCAAETITTDGMTIDIVHRQVKTEVYEEAIPFETRYFEDVTLAPEDEIVLVEGVDGVVEYKAQVTFENGVEVSREILRETETTKMVAKIVVCGVDRKIMDQTEEEKPAQKPGSSSSGGSSGSSSGSSGGVTINEGGSITTASGAVYTYSKILTVTATAYSCEGYVGTTATGTVARVGAIAVDPKVIPYGTRMYVVSNDGMYVYGYCTAEDCGGAIKGNKIDLYFDTISECYQFGRRSCTVYILT
jgi:3D (Asp-Asp-Asp) domain-containing protein/uncharacterized protein YabE (DUF348 family)